jgi:hypothetical protein
MDLSASGISKEQKKLLDRTLGFSSTHSSVSICILTQQFTGLHVRYRRLLNGFCLWNNGVDRDTMIMLARKFGGNMNRTVFAKIMNSFTSQYDFLMIDMTSNSPAKYRKGLFQKIEIETHDD